MNPSEELDRLADQISQTMLRMDAAVHKTAEVSERCNGLVQCDESVSVIIGFPAVR